MSKKPLHLQQKRYLVRRCQVPSKKALGGYAVNYWYIHDTEYDNNDWLKDLCPTVEKYRTFRTRKDAVGKLTLRLVQNKRNEEAVRSRSKDIPVGLARLLNGRGRF